MKNPLWIINSALAVLVCLLFILMLVMKSPLPKRESLFAPAAAPLQNNFSRIIPSRIYENDLFKTYVKPVVQEKPQEEENFNPPLPPQPKNFSKKPKTAPDFLPPLDIELKGVIFNSNSFYSRAIVMNRKTKQETLYKIGDTIEDAHLIYVGKNKAMFIRSNGQQESLFVTAEDAQKDSIYAPVQVSNAVEKIDDTNYIVNIDQFTKEINNLAQLLDILDITTAFDKGQSIGCHVGKISFKSLGSALGFRQDDIIVSINNHKTNTTSNRVKIYKELAKAPNNYNIPVVVMRGGRELNFTYTLHKRMPKKETETKYQRLPAGTPLSDEVKQVMRENPKITEVTQQTLSQAQTNNVIADTFKKNDKKSMVEYGGRNALLQR